MSVQANRTGGVTGSEGHEEANGVGGGIGVGGRNGDGNGVGGGSGDDNGVGGGNGDVNGHGDGDGTGAGTGTGVEVNEGAQDGNGDGSGDGAGTETRGREWRPVDEHRMGTGTGTGTEARTVVEMGTGTRVTGTGTRIGSGRAEERRRSARNLKIVVGAKWETGETWVQRRKNVEKKGLAQKLPTQIIWRVTRKQKGEHKVLRAQVRIVRVERVWPLCRVRSEVFVTSIIPCEWHRMTRMTGLNCAVMCNLINTHTQTHTS